MKFIVYSIFLFSPFLLLNYAVMPELDKMRDFYANIDVVAERAAGIETVAPEGR